MWKGWPGRERFMDPAFYQHCWFTTNKCPDFLPSKYYDARTMYGLSGKRRTLPNFSEKLFMTLSSRELSERSLFFSDVFSSTNWHCRRRIVYNEERKQAHDQTFFDLAASKSAEPLFWTIHKMCPSPYCEALRLWYAQSDCSSDG